MPILPQRQENANYAYTQSRELSWLRFNRRVLEEAGDEAVPLLERLKFISIFTSNLDEFFMVRVGNLFDVSLVSPGEIDNKTGLTPEGQLAEIYSVIPGLIEIKNRLYADVAALLRREGVCDLAMEELSPEERKFVTTYYKAKILPVLSPQIVDARHPFPHLANKALYVAGLMRSRKGTASLGFLPAPSGLPAILPMPGDPPARAESPGTRSPSCCASVPPHTAPCWPDAGRDAARPRSGGTAPAVSSPCSRW